MRACLSVVTFLLLAASVLAQDNCDRTDCYNTVLGNRPRDQVANQCSSSLVCTTTLTTKTFTIIVTRTPTTATTVVVSTPLTTTISTTTTPSTTTRTTTTAPPNIVVTRTITPSPVTSTITVTRYGTFARRDNLVRRQDPGLCPFRTVPASATGVCVGPAFSSVCSCAGVTGTTSTISTGLTTVTSTTTLPQATVTESSTAAPPRRTVTTTAPTPTRTVTSTLSSATSTTVTTATTSVSRTTTTTTNASALPTPSSCGNQGFAFAYYADSQPAGTARDNVRFDPTVIKRKTPVTTGATNYLTQNVAINNFYPPNASDYVANQNGTYFILNHRGYIYTPVDGTYTFTVNNVDDIVNTWLGSTAQSGWDIFNSISRVGFNNGRGSSTFGVYLEAGQYFPVRVLFKQAIGDDTFQYTITAPNGVVIISYQASSAPSGYAVQFSCDFSSGPAFASFGAET